jgi:outer membrane biogenesis lipoprotein LolB
MKRSAQLILVMLVALLLSACAATTGKNIHPSDTALGHNEVIGAVSGGP